MGAWSRPNDGNRVGRVRLGWAYSKPGQEVLSVAASEDASRRNMAEVRAIATASRLLAGSVVDEQAGLVTLSNDSRIASVPASERAIRGRRVDLLLGDEMAYVGDDLWLGAALPTVAARPDARVVMASSAGPASGFFYDHANRGDEHVTTWRWHLDDATWITPTAVEAFRSSMSETRFAAEMEGRFATGGDFLFTRERLEPVLADYALTDLADLRGPARLGVGVDWGHVRDRTVATVVGRFAGTSPPVFGVVSQRRWEEAYPPLRSAEEVAASPGHFAYVVSEGHGLGAPLSDHLFEALRRRPPESGGGRKARAVIVEEGGDPTFPRPRPRPPEAPRFVTEKVRVHTSNDAQAAMFSGLRMMVDAGTLLIPRAAEELVRELLLLRVDLSPTGQERIAAATGHDDCADSLALALGPYRDRQGRWRVHLPDLARRDLPITHVSTRGAKTRAGCGVEVPRAPVWQSLAGPEVTLPPGAAEDPDPHADLRERIQRRREEMAA